MGQDYTFRFQGRRYQIARQAVLPGLRGARLRVEKRLDGKLAVRFRKQYLAVSGCDKVLPQRQPEPRIRSPKGAAQPRQHSWMEGFDLQQAKPIWAALNQERGKPQADAAFRR